jgi:hypothetical protein
MACWRAGARMSFWTCLWSSLCRKVIESALS